VAPKIVGHTPASIDCHRSIVRSRNTTAPTSLLIVGSRWLVSKHDFVIRSLFVNNNKSSSYPVEGSTPVDAAHFFVPWSGSNSQHQHIRSRVRPLTIEQSLCGSELSLEQVSHGFNPQRLLSLRQYLCGFELSLEPFSRGFNSLRRLPKNILIRFQV
jgi:hypothetical protein